MENVRFLILRRKPSYYALLPAAELIQEQANSKYYQVFLRKSKRISYLRRYSQRPIKLKVSIVV